MSSQSRSRRPAGPTERERRTRRTAIIVVCAMLATFAIPVLAILFG